MSLSVEETDDDEYQFIAIQAKVNAMRFDIDEEAARKSMVCWGRGGFAESRANVFPLPAQPSHPLPPPPVCG